MPSKDGREGNGKLSHNANAVKLGPLGPGKQSSLPGTVNFTTD